MVSIVVGIGAIAQLGERLHGMQEVRGSIPLGSTKKKMKQARFEKVELNQILQLYGVMVSQGLWKDYSISFLKEFVVFSVVSASARAWAEGCVGCSNCLTSVSTRAASFSGFDIDDAISSSSGARL